jgi:hypothetical protein
MIKRIASYILFSFIAIAILATGAYGGGSGEMFPSRKSLENMPYLSAVIVIVVTVGVIGGLTWLFINAFAN